MHLHQTDHIEKPGQNKLPCNYIKEQAGKLFDPNITVMFLASV